MDLTNVSYVSADDHLTFASRGTPEKGDILYTKDGTLGIPYVVDVDFEFSFFVSVALIKLRREIADPHFIAQALEIPSVLDQVARMGAGMGLKHMVLKSIRALEVPVPPLPIQERVSAVLADRMEGFQRAHDALKSRIDTLGLLSVSLLRRAFAGGL